MNEFEMIYLKYFNIVYKYLLSITNNKEISEDLAQETFYRAILNINSFKSNSKVTTWLCEIAKNLWLNEIKHNKRLKFVNLDTIEISVIDDNIDEKVIHQEELDILYKKINLLDTMTKKVMFLRITGELSFYEIGKILNKTETWARVTYYRGKKRIKEEKENDK